MRKKLIFGVSTMVGLAAMCAIGLVFGHTSQPGASLSGAPGENNCTQCHSGTVNSGTGNATLTLSGNPTTYTPGTLYTVTINVTDASMSKFGFQVTALAGGAGASVGTFAVTNSTNTSMQTGSVSGFSRTYIAHRNANSNATWTFNWTAPATNVGTITFYLVGNATNNQNNSSGDKVYTRTFSFAATPPPPPTAAFTANTTAFCPTGTVQFTDNSTSSPTSRSWSFPGGSPATSTAANPSVTYATPGTYAVTLIVANGSGADTLTQSNYITVHALPQASAIATAANCNGGSDGSIDLTVSGTTGNTFLWSNGSTQEDPSNLAAGTYTVTVTSGNGCTTTATATVTAPTAIVLTSSSTNAACGQSNGTASISASGGMPGYTYLWSDGQTTATATGLAAGSYTVTVTDGHGCFEVGTVGVSNTGSPSGSTSITHAVCNGDQNGAIDLTVTGGTPPYAYSWSTGALSEDLSGLAAGTYTVTVTDGSGCQLTQVATVNEPQPISISMSSTPETTSGNGTATAAPSGGTGPYTYLWSNGQTTASISGLFAGTYSVTVTDANGCTETGSVTVSLSVSVAQHLSPNLFDIGPNPFSDYLTIRPSVSIYGKFVVHLIDIEGHMVFAKEVEARGGLPILVAPGPLRNGVYLIMITNEHTKVLKKVFRHEF